MIGIVDIGMNGWWWYMWWLFYVFKLWIVYFYFYIGFFIFVLRLEMEKVIMILKKKGKENLWVKYFWEGVCVWLGSLGLIFC